MAIAPVRLMTADEFLQMSFEHPVELERGEVVEMPPASFRHGEICARISELLRQWSRTTSAGLRVATSDAAILTGRSPDTVRGGDVVAVFQSRLSGEAELKRALKVAPDLVVEVLSPSDRLPKVLAKTAEYLAAGVSEVWLVDPDEHRVDVYRGSARSPRTLGADQFLTSPDLLPGFSAPVTAFFADL